MNGYQRIRRALNGERPDRTPVMLHNFMLAAREAGVTMNEYRSDPEVIARTLIGSVERYDLDGVLVDVDTATLAGALGVPVDFPEDQPALARSRALSSLSEVDNLEPVKIAESPRVQVWLEAVRILHRYFGDEVFIRGNCDQCAFSLAGMIRGPGEWLLDLTDPENHERAHQLLARCAGATAQFISLMAQTGAHMVSNGDSPAGPEMISPRMYCEFALPYEMQTVRHAHSLGLPYTLHICGNVNLILRDMMLTQADAFEIDFKTDMRLAERTLRNRATFIGNLDPNGVLAMGDPALISRKTQELIDCFRENPRFILNAGCAIPAHTPSENIRALIQATRGGSWKS